MNSSSVEEQESYPEPTEVSSLDSVMLEETGMHSPMKKSRPTLSRKSHNLSNIMKKITENACKRDQEKIIRSSMNLSLNKTVLDNLMLPNVENTPEGRLLSGVLEYLKSLDLRQVSDQKVFKKILTNVLEVKVDMDDTTFLHWLSGRVNKKYDRLLRVLNLDDSLDTRGRKKAPLETRQAIFDQWNEFSIITVDRRNGRDQVAIPKLDFIRNFNDITLPDDIKIESIVNKGGQKMYRSTRYIATKTGHQIRNKLLQGGLNVSYGTVLKYKPFYVQKGCEREKQSCLCKFCLNLRLRYNELLKNLKYKEKREDSMTKYFSNGCKCQPSENGSLQLECINGNCSECKLSSLFAEDDFKDTQANVHFHQFVVQEYTYKSKSGEQKTGKRTVRKEFEEKFSEFKENIDKKGPSYLVHRFEIKNDQFHWSKILDNEESGIIFHQDYSENISCSPKYEPQDAHFSLKQTSLHCTVVHSPGKSIRYAYHISDDKNQKIDKPIILFFGVNGHGRGLVDACSGFAVKTPLRKAIILEDFFFETDLELLEFCKKFHENDDSKYFCCLSREEIDGIRKTKDKGLPIKGCQKARMIAFFPDGTYSTKRHLCSCDSCLSGLFDKCNGDLSIRDEQSNDTVEDTELNALDETVDPEMFTFVDVNSFIALYSDSKSFELFYLLRVTYKGIATEDMIDIYGHRIQEVSYYVEGIYLEKIDGKRSMRDKVYYKELKKKVYVNPYEIFCPVVLINQEDSLYLTLAIEDYQFLAHSL